MILKTLLAWLRLPRRHSRQHQAQLRAMSDRELADLGIGRSEIPAWCGGLDGRATLRGANAHTDGSAAASAHGQSQPARFGAADAVDGAHRGAEVDLPEILGRPAGTSVP